MEEKQRKFRKGATSFYVVAFSTLILVIVAVSFASVIISAINRTSEDELSQSAYDSALAGVEDAKLAYASYIKCKEAGRTAAASEPTSLDVNCENIMYWMEHPDCDMVGHILGREITDSGVMIRETKSGDNEMQQAYTCVKIDTTIGDYRATLSSTNQTKVVQVGFSSPNAVANLDKIRVSWYTKKDTSSSIRNFTNFYNESGVSRVAFFPIGNSNISTPPTLMVGLIQTAKTFSLSDFNQSKGSQTDRATVYLVPVESNESNKSVVKKEIKSNYYIGTYDSNNNYNFISAANVTKTNDHGVINKPFAVYCNSASEFVCSVDIELPEPINGNRSNGTFAMMVSVPYGQPSTDFALQFFCKNGAVCNAEVGDINNDGDEKSVATMSNTQVEIDSTGRANNLYRRVLTRLESTDTKFAIPFYAIQLLGNGTTGSLMEKKMTVTQENY